MTTLALRPWEDKLNQAYLAQMTAQVSRLIIPLKPKSSELTYEKYEKQKITEHSLTGEMT